MQLKIIKYDDDDYDDDDLYIPNTVDTLSLASANDSYGKLVKGTIL